MGKLRQFLAVLAVCSLNAALISGIPEIGIAAAVKIPTSPTSGQERAAFEPCGGTIVDSLQCDPKLDALIPSDAKNYPQVAATVSGTIFKHSGARRGVMETSWRFPSWKNDPVPPDTPLSGITVYARWYDGSSANGAWSPRYTATSAADGSYKIALRPFVDKHGVTHTFKGQGTNAARPTDQLVRLGIKTDKHQLVWMPNNGSPISRAVVAAGLADNVSWGESIRGYNFSLADKNFKGPGQQGITVEKRHSGNAPGSCAPSLAANYYKIEGNVFWDYAQNKLGGYSADSDGEIHRAVIDWQPTIQKDKGDSPAKGDSLGYYVVAWVPDDPTVNSVPPKRAVVGWGKVRNDGTYTVLVDGSGKFSLPTRTFRLNHIMLQLVQADGGEPVLEDNKLKNVKPMDSKYGFWNPTAGQFRSWTDTPPSGTGTGLRQTYQGACINSTAYSRLYNANFALFPWQAKIETSLDGQTWAHHTTAVKSDAVQYRVTGLAPLSEYRLIADQNTALVNEFSTDKNGEWTGTLDLGKMPDPTWEQTEHTLNVVLPGVTSINLAQSPMVANSALRLVPYRVDTSPQELTVNETLAGGKQFKVEGAKVTECGWGNPAPAGLNIAPDVGGTACVISGKPAKSGNAPVVLRVKTTTDRQPTSWEALLRVHPQVLAQQTGAVNVENESAVPKFANAGQQFLGQVKVANDKNQRLMNFKLTQNGQELTEQNHLVDLGHGLKFVPGSGQIIGTPTLGATETSAEVSFTVTATDLDGLEAWTGNSLQTPVPFSINIAPPIRVIDPWLPTVIAGQKLQSPSGTAVFPWIQGGQATGVAQDSPRANSYKSVEMPGNEPGKEIPDVKKFTELGFQTTAKTIGGGQVLEIGGGQNAEVNSPTVLYLPVKVTDTAGRVFDGSQLHTLAQIKARQTALTGTEGWIRLVVLPKITAETFKDATVGEPYPANSIAGALNSEGIGQTVTVEGNSYTYGWDDYTYSAAGLPAGLKMEPDGRISGTPRESTPKAGVTVTLSLTGKAGTLAQKTALTLQVPLKVKSNFKVEQGEISATAKGGVTYTAEKSLKTATGKTLPETINPSGGKQPYSYKLQVKQGTDWQDAAFQNGRYQIPNSDGKPSGLLLEPQGNIVGSTIGSEALPEMRLVVSDSDTVSCAETGSSTTTSCSKTVVLKLRREDPRKPKITISQVVVDLKAAGSGAVAVAEGSGQYTQLELVAKNGFPQNLSFRITGTPKVINPSADTKTLQAGANTTISVGNGQAPHEFAFETLFGGAKPKVGKYPDAFTIRAKDLNGNYSEVANIAVVVTDTRIPMPAAVFPGNVTGPEEGVKLATKAVNRSAAEYFDAESADIACYVPQDSAATMGCPKAPQPLPGIPGMTLQPDGTFAGVPQKGTAGEKTASVRAITKTGHVSNPVAIPVVVAPSTLEFRPGVPVGGVSSDTEYTWTFNPATGGAEKKHYRLVNNGGKAVSGCEVDTGDPAKPVLRCGTAAIKNQTGLAVEAYTQDGDGKTRITRSAPVEFRFVEPLQIVPVQIPDTAEESPYTAADGSTFRFQLSGGLGPYEFGFEKGSPHQKAQVPDTCNGWKLYSAGAASVLGGGSRDTGLCLTVDGSITGTAAPGTAGIVDLSGLRVTDSLRRHAKLGGETKSFRIVPKLQVVSDYPSADKSLQREKNQVLAETGSNCNDPKTCSVKVATITGGVRPFQEVKLLGLGQFVKLPAGTQDRLILQRAGDGWTGTVKAAPQNGKDSGSLTVTVTGRGDGPLEVHFVGNFSRITRPGLSATLKVVGGSEQVITAPIYVQVDTDLRFVKPEGVPAGTGVGIVPAPDAGGSISKPDSLDGVSESEWNRISGGLDKTIPTLGVGLDKETVEKGAKSGLKIPKLVDGGVEPFRFLTEPCDVKAANPQDSEQLDCAIGETGLFLDSKTGQIYGNPKPGAKTAAVVIVVDSDQPPQAKRSNLVIHLGDPRKPSVAPDQVLSADKKVPDSETIVALQDGSGKYKSCAVAKAEPTAGDWLTAEFSDGVCKLKWTGLPANAAENYLVTLKVRDENGNWNTTDGSEDANTMERPVQTVSLQVADSRLPVIPSIADTIRAEEGKNLDPDAFPPLKAGEQTDGPKIKKWTVTGLPEGLVFDSVTGKISGYPKNGQVGNFDVAITAETAGGITTTKTIKIAVSGSGLRINLPALPTPTQGNSYDVTAPLTAEIYGETCNDCTFSLKNSSNNILTVDGSGAIKLAQGNTWPNGTESDTLTVVAKNPKGITAEITFTVSANKQLDMFPKALPEVYAGESVTQCFTITGGDGTQGYRIENITSAGSVSGQVDGSRNSKDTGYCATFSAASGATAQVHELTARIKDLKNNGTSEVTLQLPVKKHVTLSLTPNFVEMKKGTAMQTITAEVSGGGCFPVYENGVVRCEDASSATWEIVNGPEGLRVTEESGNTRKATVSGKVSELYEGDVTVRATRSNNHSDYQSTVTASFHLKVNTDLEVVPPTGAVVETQGDGSAVVKTGMSGTNEGSQLLPDKTTSTGGGSTGKYSIPDVTPDANGNYPIKTGGKDTGFALTPDGKIVGTLKPGIVTNTTGTTVSFPVVLTETDDKGHSSATTPKDVSFKITDTRKPEMATTVISSQVGVTASGTLPGLDKSSENGKPAYSNLSCTGQAPHELATPTSAMFNVDNSGTWTIADNFVPSKTDSQGKATWACTATITAANGQSTTGKFTLEMHDQRSPKFKADRKRYVWEGRNITPFAMRGTWIIDPASDTSVPLLQTITVQNLPEGMKVVKANGITEWKSETVTIPSVTGENRNTKKWICDLDGSSSEQCQITGHPVQGSAGQYVLTVTATGTNGVTATDYPVLVNYASALKFAPLTGAVTKATVGSGYEQPVAVADYLRPLDFTDDVAYNGAGSAAGQNTTEAWTNTWALDGAKVSVKDNRGETATGWTAELVTTSETISACDAKTQPSGNGGCTGLKQKNITLSHTAAFSKAEIGAHNLSLELTDAHGMKKIAPVTVSVYAPLEWARAPFKTASGTETAVLNPNKGITAGQPFVDESGAAIYAEAVGGNSADYSSVLAESSTILTAENADPKAAGYAGIAPIWCQAQFAAGLKPSRPKCFPVPGLVPTAGVSGTESSPYSGEGVFLLANGKFVGSVPAGTNLGINEAQVAVMDANHDLITKKFNVQVYAPLSAAGSPASLPDGTRKQSYAPVEIFTVSGGSNSGYSCSFTPAIAGLECEVDAGGKVTLSGTPTVTFKGKIQITVKDKADPSRSITQGVDLEIKTDLAFANPSVGAPAPAGSSVSVENGSNEEQTLKITTGGNGKALEGSIPLNVTGGDVTPGATPGTPKGYVFRLTDSHGNPIMGATCIDDPKTSADESKITDSRGATHERVCYPIGNTGLQLTSDGKVIGTPIPGTKSDSFAVVADHALPPSTKSAKLDITIHDYRQPKAYPAKLSTTVGATTLTGYVSHDDFTNPPGVDPADTFSTEQQTAAGKTGFYAIFPEDSWTKGKAPASARQGCDGKTMPDWLTIDRNGKIGLATGKTVPPTLEDRASSSGKQAKPSGKYDFCVWYVGTNGMVSNPTTVSVTVTDNRNATPGANNGAASRATVTPGTAVTKAPDPNVMTWEIPADLLQHSGSNIVKTNDVKKNGQSIYFTTTPTGYIDTEIPGLKGKGECADNSAGGKTCEFWVEGTPTPAGAGRSYNLTYTLTLANNQILVISKEVIVEAYNLSLSAGAMPVAWVGEPYTPGAISASGGIGTDLPIAPSGIATIKSYDPAGKFLDSNGAIWAPSEADAQTAAKNSAHPGFLTLQLQVTDKTACDSWTTPGVTCPYVRRLEVQIPVAKRPSDTAIQGMVIPQGSSWSSEPLMDSPNLQTQPGRHQEIISAQNDSGQPIPAGAIAVADNKLQVGSTVPPGKYTVTVKTTVPGFGDFYRVVNFTVKEKPAVKPAPKPNNPAPVPSHPTTSPTVTPTVTPTAAPSTTPTETPTEEPSTPSPSPSQSQNSGDTSWAAPAFDSNRHVPPATPPKLQVPLIARHGGVNREATALSVLDYFDGQHTGPVSPNRYIAAYPEYEEKSHANWSDTAVLVRDDDYADSLVSGPLAAELGAPVLLTSSEAMNIVTMNQLVQRGFKRVVIVGNSAAVSERVAQTITAAGFRVERLGGANRYATATAVADRILQIRGSHSSEVFMATGKNYPDALSASAAAIKQRGVVLLTPQSRTDTETESWVKSAKSGSRHAIGGPAVSAIERYRVPVVKKVMGKNRYQTAAAVASTFFPPSPARVVIATGRDFPDATVATAITAKTGAPVTLTPATRLAPITGKYLHASKNSIRKVDVLGGNAAVNPKVEAEIRAVVTGK